jgi:multiple sugar transport system ATP-binding protein
MERTQHSAPVNPNTGAQEDGQHRIEVDLNNIHLQNEASGAVL